MKPRKSPARKTRKNRFKPIRILIVDDDRAIAEVCEECLLSNGFKVLRAHDGKSGLASARRAKPDLVILNQAMPRMTGMEVLRELRADPGTRALKIIMNSVDAKYETLAREAGADGFFQMPVAMADLLRRVHGVLSR